MPMPDGPAAVCRPNRSGRLLQKKQSWKAILQIGNIITPHLPIRIRITCSNYLETCGSGHRARTRPIPDINLFREHWENTTASLCVTNMCCAEVRALLLKITSERHTGTFSMQMHAGSLRVSGWQKIIHPESADHFKKKLQHEIT